MKKDKRIKKLVKEIKDSEKQLSIQKTKLGEVEKDLSNDGAVLADYRQQVVQAIKADVTELKNLNKRIQDIERDINVKQRMQNQIQAGIETLIQNIKEQKGELRTLLTWIVKREKITLEYTKVSEIFDGFIKVNRDFVDSVHAVFDELKLRRLDVKSIALNARGNYAFVEHMSFLSCPIPTPFQINNAKSHQDYYEKKVKKYERIISGEKKQPKEQPKELEEKNIIEKISDSIKSGIAKKVKPGETEQLFG